MDTHTRTFGVAPLLAAIGEPVSTFYDRTNRQPSARAVADAAVAERISAIGQRSRRRPARHAVTPRWPEKASGVGRKRVERQLGIQGAHLHKHWKTTRARQERQRRTRSGRAGFHRAALCCGPDLYQKRCKESSIWRWCWMCFPARW
jgi:hypothetical protein